MDTLQSDSTSREGSPQLLKIAKGNYDEQQGVSLTLLLGRAPLQLFTIVEYD